MTAFDVLNNNKERQRNKEQQRPIGEGDQELEKRLFQE
jgi:hypothetical protein